MAKEQGNHLGRPKAEYPKDWKQEYQAWKDGEQTAKLTMEHLDLKRTTFYKLVKLYKETENQSDK